MRELLDVLDENGNSLGIVKPKDLIKKDGNFYRAIMVVIINNDKEILFTKRSSDKEMYPGLWSMFITGHIRSSEASIDGALREIKEEIGINVLNQELNYLYTIKDQKKKDNHIENVYFDTYILYKDIDINEIKMNEEVDGCQFVSMEDTLYLIDNKSPQIVPNDKEYDMILNYLNEKGMIKRMEYGRRINQENY